MANLKKQAYELYKLLLQEQNDNIGNNDFDYVQSVFDTKAKICGMLLNYLQKCRPEEKFAHKELLSIIHLSAKDDNFHPRKAAEAFENLEHYVVLIHLMPWKREFHKINQYCGFYQAKVHAHLRNAESIFRYIGYAEVATGMLGQVTRPEPEFLKSVAFECLVASTECQIIDRIWQRTLTYNISISDIVHIALFQAGTEDQVVCYIESEFNKIRGSPANFTDSQNITNCVKPNAKSVIISSNHFRNKLETYMLQAEKLQSSEIDYDIPFMDEEETGADYMAACLDEHILASLKQIEDNSDSSTSKNSTLELKPPQEWSFFREGITKKYGEQYFEGILKDILPNESEKTNIPNPQGYQLAIASSMPQPHGYANADNDVMQIPNFEHIKKRVVAAGNYYIDTSVEHPVVDLRAFDEGNLRARGSVPQRKQITDTFLKKQCL